MKQLAMAVFFIVGSVSSYAESGVTDVFSHTILTLPTDPEENDTWVKMIHTQAEWDSFFYATTAAITTLSSDPFVAPSFDFTNYKIISGGVGRQGAGFYLAIDRVVELEDEVSIHVLNIGPEEGCLPLFSGTHPSITLLVEKSEKPIHFVFSDLISSCEE